MAGRAVRGRGAEERIGVGEESVHVTKWDVVGRTQGLWAGCSRPAVLVIGTSVSARAKRWCACMRGQFASLKSQFLGGFKV